MPLTLRGTKRHAVREGPEVETLSCPIRVSTVGLNTPEPLSSQTLIAEASPSPMPEESRTVPVCVRRIAPRLTKFKVVCSFNCRIGTFVSPWPAPLGAVGEAADLQRHRADRDGADVGAGRVARRRPAERIGDRLVEPYGLGHVVAVGHPEPRRSADAHADHVVGDGRVADVVGDEERGAVGPMNWSALKVTSSWLSGCWPGRTRRPCARARRPTNSAAASFVVPSRLPRDRMFKHGRAVDGSTPGGLAFWQPGPVNVMSSALLTKTWPPIGAPFWSTGKPSVEATTMSNGGVAALEIATPASC